MNPLLLPPKLLAQLDMAIFRLEQDGSFSLLGEAPAWLRDIYPKLPLDGTPWHPEEYILYLAHFIEIARDVWAGNGSTQIVSDIWTEEATSGREWLLEATALNMDGQPLLLIKFPSSDFKTLRSV